MTDDARGLLREAVKVIDSLDAIIAGEISNDWADFFGKDWEDMYNIKSRITAHLAAPALEQWRPIETAPEDEWVLVTNGKWRGLGKKEPLSKMNYPEPSEQWQDEHTEFIEHCGPKLIGWQPLPPLPQEEK